MKLDGLDGKNLLLLAGVLVLALFALSLFLQPKQQSNEASTETLFTVKVGYLPILNSLPLFVAVDQGLFAKRGIDVELVRFEAPPQMNDALIAGRIDASPSAATGIVALSDIKKPGAIKIFSFACSTKDALSDELLVARNSTISSISGLKGHKLGILPGIQFITIAKKILIENGLQPSDVALVEIPVPNQLAALQSGGVDALLTLEPTATIGEQKGVSRVLVANPMVKYVAEPWCSGAGVVSATFLESNPIEARAFVGAIYEAIGMTGTDPAGSRSSLVKYLNLPEAVAQKVPFVDWVGTGYRDPAITAAYQKFADVFFELNVTQSRIDVSVLLLEE